MKFELQRRRRVNLWQQREILTEEEQRKRTSSCITATVFNAVLRAASFLEDKNREQLLPEQLFVNPSYLFLTKLPPLLTRPHREKFKLLLKTLCRTALQLLSHIVLPRSRNVIALLCQNQEQSLKMVVLKNLNKKRAAFSPNLLPGCNLKNSEF